MECDIEWLKSSQSLCCQPVFFLLCAWRCPLSAEVCVFMQVYQTGLVPGTSPNILHPDDPLCAAAAHFQHLTSVDHLRASWPVGLFVWNADYNYASHTFALWQVPGRPAGPCALRTLLCPSGLSRSQLWRRLYRIYLEQSQRTLWITAHLFTRHILTSAKTAPGPGWSSLVHNYKEEQTQPSPTSLFSTRQLREQINFSVDISSISPLRGVCGRTFKAWQHTRIPVWGNTEGSQGGVRMWETGSVEVFSYRSF